MKYFTMSNKLYNENGQFKSYIIQMEVPFHDHSFIEFFEIDHEPSVEEITAAEPELKKLLIEKINEYIAPLIQFVDALGK